MRPEIVTSAANPLVKDVRRAIARGTLTSQGCCVAETFHLLEEALRSDCEVRTVLVAESVRTAAETHVRGLARVKVAVLPDSLFQAMAGTETSQGVMALVKPPWFESTTGGHRLRSATTSATRTKIRCVRRCGR